jgi:hypothetical protein
VANIQSKQITLTTELRQVQALLKLVQRASMSEAEVCFVEDLFSDFFQQVRDQQSQDAALAKLAALATQQAPDGALGSEGVASTVS